MVSPKGANGSAGTFQHLSKDQIAPEAWRFAQDAIPNDSLYVMLKSGALLVSSQMGAARSRSTDIFS